MTAVFNTHSGHTSSSSKCAPPGFDLRRAPRPGPRVPTLTAQTSAYITTAARMCRYVRISHLLSIEKLMCNSLARKLAAQAGLPSLSSDSSDIACCPDAWPTYCTTAPDAFSSFFLTKSSPGRWTCHTMSIQSQGLLPCPALLSQRVGQLVVLERHCVGAPGTILQIHVNACGAPPPPATDHPNPLPCPCRGRQPATSAANCSSILSTHYMDYQRPYSPASLRILSK